MVNSKRSVMLRQVGTRSDALFDMPHFHGKVDGQMPSVNTASLRDEFDAVKAEIASLRKESKISNPRFQSEVQHPALIAVRA